MRIMGVDPGEKRIGLAVSDETGLIANPLGIVIHTSRRVDAQTIIARAESLSITKIVIGLSLDEEGNPSSSGRKAQRLGEEIRQISGMAIEYIDEYGTTNLAQSVAREMNLKKKDRKGHRDEVAAVIILQMYLDKEKQETK